MCHGFVPDKSCYRTSLELRMSGRALIGTRDVFVATSQGPSTIPGLLILDRLRIIRRIGISLSGRRTHLMEGRIRFGHLFAYSIDGQP